jgi:hypothetical protein
LNVVVPASAIQQEENCIERESRDRPSSKLQSAIYYALDGDQVTILTMLAQRSEDPWVSRSTRPNRRLNLYLERHFPGEEASLARGVRTRSLALHPILSYRKD